jgi:DNA polymerase/3'-5' exonuclease PolX
MTDQSKQTLMTIQRLLEAGQTTPYKALVAAFSLGRLEGLAEMAAVGRERMKDLMEKAA